ncbi:MAG: hypothetical protein LBS04_02975 [Tannerellaceae bacterium]|nr:hypothetical protein [Tannerellaceae bacterium]
MGITRPAEAPDAKKSKSPQYFALYIASQIASASASVASGAGQYDSASLHFSPLYQTSVNPLNERSFS